MGLVLQCSKHLLSGEYEQMIVSVCKKFLSYQEPNHKHIQFLFLHESHLFSAIMNTNAFIFLKKCSLVHKIIQKNGQLTMIQFLPWCRLISHFHSLYADDPNH